MKFEKSCGAIVYQRLNNELYFLILQHTESHWSFPKGHVEDNETEIETAQREVEEETGLDITIESNFRQVITYSPGVNCMKDVVYFIGEVKNPTIHLQENEIIAMKWCVFEDAIKLVTFDLDKDVLVKANEYITHANLK